MVIGILGFRQPRNSGISPAGMGLLRSIEAKFVKAFRFVSIGRSSRKFSSSSLTLARSRSYAEIIDSHRVEAIEDCIEFLNSSSSSSSSSFSSLQRSNSVSANSSC
ncbi:josephin-like protein [Diospyros lotus]|uniref:josephin-like protein n=1 Tax=Diospyros lotus TaxID=55363 RepID=UPI00225788B8|nr:josephin-like protein [Diospyros lotus]